MIECKFCKKQSNKNYSGYCISCYQYFIVHENDTWYPSQYGELARVNDENHKQYGMPICHICGKAFTKLQQHIWYAHNMTKDEYCDNYGLDRKINMTTESYNKKMSDYAYKYNMDEQLRKAGKKTRFQKGHNGNYKRSYQTKQRLMKQGAKIGHEFNKGKNNKSKN